MLDLGWSEMAVVAVLALLVLGPKELPNALRTVALWVRKARRLAREFQSGVDELVREAELEDAKKTLQSASRVNLDREVERAIDPTGEVSRTMRSDLDGEGTKPARTPPDEPAKPAGGAAASPPPAAESTDEPSQSRPAKEPADASASKSP